jgi:hypothetical protein
VRSEFSAVVGLSIEKFVVHFSAKVMANFYGQKITSASPRDGLFASSMLENMPVHAVFVLPIRT